MNRGTEKNNRKGKLYINITFLGSLENLQTK